MINIYKNTDDITRTLQSGFDFRISFYLSVIYDTFSIQNLLSSHYNTHFPPKQNNIASKN